jgi:hypothetical protein
MKWEGIILTKIYGPTYGTTYWKMRLDEDIYNKLKPPTIVTVIQISKLE